MRPVIALVVSESVPVDRLLLTQRIDAWADLRDVRVTVVFRRLDGWDQEWEDLVDGLEGLVIDPGPSWRETFQSMVRPLGCPVVVADLSRAHRGPAFEQERFRVIHGRGIDTYRWAVQSLLATLRSPATLITYGNEASNVAELRVGGGAHLRPVVVMLHGGYWRDHWGLDTLDDLAIAITEQGFATLNVEYRRGRGSLNHALNDIESVLEQLPDLARGHALDLSDVRLLGHSAGGQLAMVASRRWERRRGETSLLIGGVVALAPVLAMKLSATRGLGEDAVVEFVGDATAEDDVALSAVDPLSDPPRSIPVHVLQGTDDSADLIDLGKIFERRVRGRARIVREEVPGVDHFQIIDPRSSSWPFLVRALAGSPRAQ